MTATEIIAGEIEKCEYNGVDIRDLTRGELESAFKFLAVVAYQSQPHTVGLSAKHISVNTI